jgi:hypothetical protein
MAKKRNKYDYLYVLQGDYGYGHGWEDLTAYDKGSAGGEGAAWLYIRRDLKDYRINEGGTYRIIERRERRR